MANTIVNKSKITAKTVKHQGGAVRDTSAALDAVKKAETVVKTSGVEVKAAAKKKVTKKPAAKKKVTKKPAAKKPAAKKPAAKKPAAKKAVVKKAVVKKAPAMGGIKKKAAAKKKR